MPAQELARSFHQLGIDEIGQMGRVIGFEQTSGLAAMHESIGPPYQMSNCGLARSLRRRVRPSPEDRRTNSTVTWGLILPPASIHP